MSWNIHPSEANIRFVVPAVSAMMTEHAAQAGEKIKSFNGLRNACDKSEVAFDLVGGTSISSGCKMSCRHCKLELSGVVSSPPGSVQE